MRGKGHPHHKNNKVTMNDDNTCFLNALENEYSVTFRDQASFEAVLKILAKKKFAFFRADGRGRYHPVKFEKPSRSSKRARK
jgi:hypothetical protein